MRGSVEVVARPDAQAQLADSFQAAFEGMSNLAQAFGEVRSAKHGGSRLQAVVLECLRANRLKVVGEDGEPATEISFAAVMCGEAHV